jgi:hypothetical protein
VNPSKREIEVYRSHGSYSLVKNGDALEGEDVVPCFRCPLAEIFAEPPMANSAL